MSCACKNDRINGLISGGRERSRAVARASVHNGRGVEQLDYEAVQIVPSISQLRKLHQIA